MAYVFRVAKTKGTMKKQNETTDLEELRLKYLEEIQVLSDKIIKAIKNQKTQQFWERAYEVIDQEPEGFRRDKLKEGVAQILVFDLYLKTLTDFVYLKAPEFEQFFNQESSLRLMGNLNQKVRAFSESVLLVGNRLGLYLKQWEKMKPKQLIEDEVFLGLAKVPIEDQIFLEAQRIEEIAPYYKPKRRYRKKKNISSHD